MRSGIVEGGAPHVRTGEDQLDFRLRPGAGRRLLQKEHHLLQDACLPQLDSFLFGIRVLDGSSGATAPP